MEPDLGAYQHSQSNEHVDDGVTSYQDQDGDGKTETTEACHQNNPLRSIGCYIQLYAES